MFKINDVKLTGNLGADCMHKAPSRPGDRHFVAFDIAHTRRYKKNDEWEESTLWKSVKALLTEEKAQALLPKLKKGAPVYVEGRLDAEKKVIKGEERTFEFIRASEIQVEKRAESSPQESQPPPSAEKAQPDNFNPANW